MKKQISLFCSVLLLFALLIPTFSFSIFADGKTLTTDKTEYIEGEPIQVTATGDGSDWVAIYPNGETPGGGTDSIRWYYVAQEGNQSGETKDIREAKLNDSRSDLKSIPAGEYTVYLLADNGYAVITSVEITVMPLEKKLTTDKGEYIEGEPIFVTATTGNSSDWVGIYKKGEVPASNGVQSIRWYNVDRSGEAKDIREAGLNDSRSDLKDIPAGEYTVYLLANNGYDVITQVDITVVKKAADVYGYVQTKPGKTAGAKDMRVLAEVSLAYLEKYEKATLKVAFTTADGKNPVYTMDATDAYTSVMANGESIKAKEGYAFVGVVIEGVTDATSVCATISFDGGAAIDLGSAKLD